ncbi:MAG: hypothetical protein ACHP8B_16680 [Terriglobales bacterium]
MTVEEYLSKVIAEPLTHELQLILNMKQVTRNTALLGSYTEALVRQLSRRVVHPFLRVSTGSVIDYPLADSLLQIDVILWAPHPAPSVYEVDDFGLVPRSSAFGVVEIKRSNYSDVDHELDDFIKKAPDLVYAEQEFDPQGHAMGIVSVLEEKPSGLLQSLIDGKTVAAFFEKSESGVDVRKDDVLNFINFLHRTKRSYQRTATMGQHIQLKTRS